MGQSLDLLLDEAARDGAITAEETLAVRRALYGDGGAVGDAFRLLYEADMRRDRPSPEWSALFVEAALDVALRETPPQGHFPPDKAARVMEAIGTKGALRVDTVLEALVAIVEKADRVPPGFSAFVLRQVKEAAIYSDGVTARGERLTPGAVGAPELRLIQRVVWGAGDEGRLAVSREEAEALFDIADATAGAANCAEWDDFFAGALGNYLIGATGRQAPSREQAFQWWETDYKADALGMLGSMVRRVGETSFSDIAGDMPRHRLSAQMDARITAENKARDAAIAEAEKLSGEKGDWIVDRMRRNGALSAPESALMRFLEREAAQLPQALRDLAAAAPRKTPGRETLY